MADASNNGPIDDDLMEIRADFVAECREVIQDIEPMLVQLDTEADGTAVTEALDRVFRLFHSVKGSAGFLGLDQIVRVTHVTESLLPPLREDPTRLTPRHVNEFCGAIDTLTKLLDAVETTHSDTGVDVDETVARLEELLLAGAAKPADAQPTPEAGPPEAGPPEAEPPEAGPPADTAAPPAEPEAPAFEEKQGAASSAPSDVPQDTWESFAAEAGDQLEHVETLGLQLESGKLDDGLVDAAFRAMHTFKGNCGFLGLGDAERIASTIEDILDKLRSGKQDSVAGKAQVVLKAVDILRHATCQNNGPAEPIEVADALVNELRQSAPAARTKKAARSPTPSAATSAAPAAPASGAPAAVATPAATAHATKFIRVDIRKLDALLDQVGELITTSTSITQNQAFQSEALEHLQQPAALLNRVTSGLHDTAMAMRMVPLGTMFRKMLRVVRDVSKKVDKIVELRLDGEDTEVDKTVIEALADPMVHMIRNSIDHGIETQDQRSSSGKPVSGIVRLSAKHQGGEVWITIEDDGAGIDPARLIKKAQEKGLVGDEASDFSDQQAYQLLFLPGFSTAAKVTGISGRGVGMDVVRRNLEAIRGRVDVASNLGRGTKLTIRIPLTLAIIDAMLARVGDRLYAFPVLSIRASLRVDPKRIVQLPGGTECLRVRNRVVEIMRIHQFHEVPTGCTDLQDGILILLEDAGETLAVFVDEIIGQRQIVIKGLEPFLGTISGISGCSVTGTGEITLVVDANDLIRGRKTADADLDEVA